MVDCLGIQSERKKEGEEEEEEKETRRSVSIIWSSSLFSTL